MEIGLWTHNLKPNLPKNREHNFDFLKSYSDAGVTYLHDIPSVRAEAQHDNVRVLCDYARRLGIKCGGRIIKAWSRLDRDAFQADLENTNRLDGILHDVVVFHEASVVHDDNVALNRSDRRWVLRACYNRFKQSKIRIHYGEAPVILRREAEFGDPVEYPHIISVGANISRFPRAYELVRDLKDLVEGDARKIANQLQQFVRDDPETYVMRTNLALSAAANLGHAKQPKQIIVQIAERLPEAAMVYEMNWYKRLNVDYLVVRLQNGKGQGVPPTTTLLAAMKKVFVA